MNKNTYRSRGVPVIQDNGYGGCLHITKDKQCIVSIQQQDMVLDDHSAMIIEVLHHQLMGDIQQGLQMLVSSDNVTAGKQMMGELREYKRHSPLDDTDPLLHMVVDGNGVPVKDEQGRYTWAWIEYVPNELETE